MRQKTYRGDSFDEILDRALRDLGEDAVVLSTRRLEGERSLHEVVVGSVDAAVVVPVEPTMRARIAGRTDGAWTPRFEVAVPRPAGPPAVLTQARSSELVALLEAAGIESGLARRLVRESAGTGEQPEQAVRARIARLLGHDAEEGGERRVLLLAGPSGSGKTTLAAKLAAHHRFRLGRSPLLVSLDSLRVGGVEQLRTFAEALDVPFVALDADDAQGLKELLRERQDAAPVIIDSPGSLFARSDERERLTRWLGAVPAGSLHLVLSAASSALHVDRAIHLAAAFAPSGLVFTRLDEVDAVGLMVTACAQAGRPLRYISDGPRVPGDLKLAAPAQLARRVLPGPTLNGVPA